MSHNPINPMLPFGTDKCQCPTCKEYFNSTYAFDKHRTGKWGERRCLSLADMQSAGWSVSPSGHWLSPRRTFLGARARAEHV
jgi:hypothetical protein